MQRQGKMKKISVYRRSSYEEMIIGPPVDLSFKNASSIEELSKKKVQAMRTGKMPCQKPNHHFVSSTLWLSNNLLMSISQLTDLVTNYLEDPANLCWLDLSFNQIHKIENEIVNFPNLKILYLHGNKISNITEVIKLRKLSSLKVLSLHGNPIEDLSCYRNYITHVLPQLKNLDFSRILTAERKKVLPVGFFKMIRNSE